MLYFPLVVVTSAFVSIVITSVSGQCPLQCSCLVLHSADCTNSSLSEIPQSGFNQHLTQLKASFNKITTLGQDSLRNIQELTHLNLSYNIIFSISSQAFMTLKHLKYLDLTKNYITSIDSGTFMYNKELEWLSLAANPTFALLSKGFHIPNLLFWNLSYCNIEDIHLSTFKEIGKLRQLYLNSNKIVSLDNRVFRNLNQLQTLDLCYNFLQNIDARIFSRLSDLRSLSLCHNNVSRITITLLQAVIRIEKVDLEGNPLICDCDSADAYSSCARDKNCSLNLTCEFPDDLKQEHWSVIDALECKTTTVSGIATSSERETVTTTDQTEESTRPTLSAESPDEEISLRTDVWLWVMIVLSVLCLVTLVCVIFVSWKITCRYRNENDHQSLEMSHSLYND
jgi:insulin-like growth factor-binding protein complex acid labile subunit